MADTAARLVMARGGKTQLELARGTVVADGFEEQEQVQDAEALGDEEQSSISQTGSKSATAEQVHANRWKSRFR